MFFLINMVPSKSGGIVPCTGMKSPEGGFGDTSFRCSFVLTRGYFAVICIEYSALGDRKFSKIWTPATRPEDNLCNLISSKMLMNHLMLEGILVRRGALAPHGWLVSGSFVFVSDLSKFRGFKTKNPRNRESDQRNQGQTNTMPSRGRV